MINKQSLWFLTLFSLILVLSVYYITMPNELLLTNNSNYTDKTSIDDEPSVTISENELLVSMRVSLEEERNEMVSNLKGTLTSEEATTEEKNDAYEQIKYLTDLKGKEEAIEEKIKNNLKIDSFVKVTGNEVKVVAEVNDEITFDGLGYDIISFNESREHICIEVKTSYGTKDKPFFITQKEIDILEGVCKDYDCKYSIIYYVLINGPDVTIKTITQSEFNELKKEPYLYIVR